MPLGPVTPSLLLRSALATGVRFAELLKLYVLCKHNLSDPAAQTSEKDSTSTHGEKRVSSRHRMLNGRLCRNLMVEAT